MGENITIEKGPCYCGIPKGYKQQCYTTDCYQPL